MEILYISLAILFIISGSFLGLLFVSKKSENFIQKNIKYFIAFSAGVFLMTVFSVLKESVHLSGGLFYPFLFAVLGFLFAILLNIYLPESHQHHEKNCKHTKNKKLAQKVLIGDSVHNITDGLIIVPAFLVSPYLGFITTISIFIHEFLQEISEFFVLKKAGYSTRKAIFRNFLTSLTILIGVIISFLILKNLFLQVFLLSFSAGIFINIILKDLLPKVYEKISYKKKMKYFILIFLGFITLFIFKELTPHSHVFHDDNDNHHNHNNQNKEKKMYINSSTKEEKEHINKQKIEKKEIHYEDTLHYKYYEQSHDHHEDNHHHDH